ncbi:hypothetical protein [Legionella cardiaca]|uniref:Ankyrin repeat protein n=1 Tax=Legionella cardiaca TaxID=1071983 RepID=A0ABY8ASB8_9GAMM|nr:hypothetical protein [Legionella cardiaca]WED42067.1 hypothetical protein PXX05_08985 [Legionella cardiaca]
MKPENVFKIYELIMTEYNKLLPILLINTEENNLHEIKEKLKTLATDTAPTCASGECADFADVNTDAKIMAASLAAFNIASDKVKDIHDGEEYKEKFKTAFDAALRVELYRQFLSLDQDLNELRNKFIINDPSARVTLKSLMNFLYEEISKNINSEFSKFEKVQGSVKPDDLEKINSMRQDLTILFEKFKKVVDENQSIEVIQNASLEFQIKAGQLIRGYEVKNESNESWTPFLKNMLMLVTIIGTIPAVISLLTKAVTGSYAFFDKPIIRKTSAEEVAPEDKLLGTLRT